MRYHAAGTRGLEYIQYTARINPREGNMGQDSLHTCTLHGIVHGIRFTTWFAVHIYRLTHTQSLFFFS